VLLLVAYGTVDNWLAASPLHSQQEPFRQPSYHPDHHNTDDEFVVAAADGDGRVLQQVHNVVHLVSENIGLVDDAPLDTIPEKRKFDTDVDNKLS